MGDRNTGKNEKHKDERERERWSQTYSAVRYTQTAEKTL